ncbi:MAG: divergent polysaccharide deacetylase family protein [Alphaproteobacteria bacterium]
MKSGYALLLAAMLALPASAKAAVAADDAIWSEPLDPIIVTATHSATQHGEAVAEGVQNIIDTEPLPMNLRHAKPVIAIVIDDMGLDRARNPKVLNLPKEVTLAYLPYSPNVRWQASQALNAGHELLLHMPMEPERQTANPGPNYLGASMNPLELQSRLVKNLTAFSGYVGINNHMGSKLTCSRDALAVVMTELKERGLSFLDSRTGDCSTAETVARENGVKTTHRDIFIDHSESAAAAAHALVNVEAAARRTGSAIAIGHPKDNTIAALAKWLPTLEAKGFQLVPVSQVIELRNWRKPAGATVAAAPSKPAPRLVAASLPEPVPAITPAPEPVRLVSAAAEDEVRETATLPVIPVKANVSAAEMAERVPVAVVVPPPLAEPIQIAAIPVPVPAAQPENVLIENMDDNGNIIAPPALIPSPRIAGLSYKTDAQPVVEAAEAAVVEHEDPAPALVPSPRITGLSYKTDAKSLNN